MTICHANRMGRVRQSAIRELVRLGAATGSREDQIYSDGSVRRTACARAVVPGRSAAFPPDADEFVTCAGSLPA